MAAGSTSIAAPSTSLVVDPNLAEAVTVLARSIPTLSTPAERKIMDYCKNLKNMGCKVFIGLLESELAWSWLQKLEMTSVTLQIEFMNLKQGGITVAKYKQKFSELSEFAPTMVATNADRCKKFQDGLHVSIPDRLTTLDTDDFNKWVNMAIKAEQNLKKMKDRDEKFRKRKG